MRKRPGLWTRRVTETQDGTTDALLRAVGLVSGGPRRGHHLGDATVPKGGLWDMGGGGCGPKARPLDRPLLRICRPGRGTCTGEVVAAARPGAKTKYDD